MQFDWITVSAQIINFLVLVWLLKRFLYQPVLNIMANREALITERLKIAATREQAADEKQLQYQNQADELNRKRDEFLGDTREQAQLEKLQLMEQAREEVSESRAHWQRQTYQEKEEFLKSLQRNALDSIQTISRKALADLADAELEERIVDVFIKRLKALDEASHKALSTIPGPVNILTSFELAPNVRGRLTRAVHEHIAAGLDIDYNTSEDLVCGISLTAGGRRLAWNMADYLAQLSSRVDEVFDATRATE
jgi:F-type H+-transporting ATPase subunit b